MTETPSGLFLSQETGALEGPSSGGKSSKAPTLLLPLGTCDLGGPVSWQMGPPLCPSWVGVRLVSSCTGNPVCSHKDSSFSSPHSAESPCQDESLRAGTVQRYGECWCQWLLRRRWDHNPIPERGGIDTACR